MQVYCIHASKGCIIYFTLLVDYFNFLSAVRHPFTAEDPLKSKTCNFLQIFDKVIYIFYIYIYAFSRCFYPKRLTVHSGYTFVLSVCLLIEWPDDEFKKGGNYLLNINGT